MLARSSRKDFELKDRSVSNRILASLAPVYFNQMRPFLKPVELSRRTFAADPTRRMDALYFVEHGLVSRIARTAFDGSVEVATVGRSGFVGVSIVLGAVAELQHSEVVVPGYALRIAAEDMNRLMTEFPQIRDHLVMYVHLLLHQKAQVALCNTKHEIDKRLARWLLLAYENVGISELPVTHEQLARFLGVRRPSISDALSNLQSADIISKARSALKLRDEQGLRSRACECCRVIDGIDRILRSTAIYEHRI
jgi:CRP-like cAMP-binding protein